MNNTNEQYVQVQNLTDNPVVYNIAEDNVHRTFGPYEIKQLPKEEIKKLYFQPGGDVLLRDFLRLDDKDLALSYGVSEDVYEHEYKWDRAKVDEVLREGDLDVLKDALDFAPEGIIDLIVDRAVAIRIPDVNKRQIIYKMTGRNIDVMIKNQIALEQSVGKTENDAPKERRVNTKENESSAGRRVQ